MEGNEPMSAITYRQNGCNRGGRDHASQLLEKLPEPAAGSLQVELADREPGRAAALAPLFSSRGLPVKVCDRPAPLASPATVDVYAVDDAEATARAVERRPSWSLLELALLLSVPTIEGVGGVVLGVAASLTPGAVDLRAEVRNLLGQISALTPGRQSSAFMSAQRVHTGQMVEARHATHDRLTSHSVRFLASKRVDPELVVVDGFTGTPYRVAVLNAKEQTPRRVLRQVALEEILPQFNRDEETQGVVFTGRSDPWLYAVLARRRASTWHLERAAQLPVVVPAPEPEAQPEKEPRWTRAVAFVTD